MSEPKNSNTCDVLIAGAGLAGLTLARQLIREMPELKIVVADKMKRPLPEAAHKVGESAAEAGSHYLANQLGLKDYLEAHHYNKYGIRYFLGDPKAPIQGRTEWGTDTNMPIGTFQLDRGRLENDLRQFNVDDGILLLEGRRLLDVTLSDGDHPHLVHLKHGNSGQTDSWYCRWFIDAMGRRRFLQRKMGYARESQHQASAVWFRMRGRLDLEDIVPAHERDWHARVPGQRRYFSTNHLMGHGYWLWLIPLSTDHTSIGIVTDETIHPYRQIASYRKAQAFLAEHQPQLAAYLQGRDPVDFMGLRDFSYHSRKVFSHRRWACVGESGVFLDPLYSPGTDFIAIANTMVAEMIGRDLRPFSDPDKQPFNRRLVNRFNRMYLGFADIFFQTYRDCYPIFGNDHIMRQKILWDTGIYWGWTCQLFFNGLLRQPEHFPRILDTGLKYGQLHRVVQNLFRQWAAAEPRAREPVFITPLDIPIFRDLHVDLLQEKSPSDLAAYLDRNLDRFEEWAQVLFFKSLRDVQPGRAGQFGANPWVNAWAIDLDEEHWSESGLLQPESTPRELFTMEQATKIGNLVPA